MALFKLFHATKTLEEDIQREKDCLLRIKNAVSQKCGIDNFIDYDDFTVAFAGSKNEKQETQIQYELWQNGLSINPEDYIVF